MAGIVLAHGGDRGNGIIEGLPGGPTGTPASGGAETVGTRVPLVGGVLVAAGAAPYTNASNLSILVVI